METRAPRRRTWDPSSAILQACMSKMNHATNSRARLAMHMYLVVYYSSTGYLVAQAHPQYPQYS